LSEVVKVLCVAARSGSALCSSMRRAWRTAATSAAALTAW